MGKARIVGGGTDGLYTVRIERDLARVRRRIEALTLERSRLSAQIAQQVQLRAAAADALLLATGAATDAWSALPAGDVDGYQAAMRAAAEAQMKAQTAEAVLAIADSDLGLLRLRDQAAEADIQRLQAIPEYVQIPAWCADLTETLAPDSVVGLMLPGDERAPGVSPVIRPGYGGAAAYSAERDGQLQPVVASTPAQTALHLARLPFRQRWKPRVRTAVITAISGDTCSLLLDDQRSTQQNLPTIPHTGDTPAGEAGAPRTLTDVPITYMDCNGAAFEAGDRVMVTFPAQTWESARVVGFYSNPRPCNSAGMELHNAFVQITALLSEGPFNLETGYSNSVDESGSFSIIYGTDTVALIEYDVEGACTLTVNSSTGLGGTVVIDATFRAWATIHGRRIKIADFTYSHISTFSHDTSILTSAETSLTGTRVAVNYSCEQQGYEYWQHDIYITASTAISPETSDAASLVKYDAASVLIGSRLLHSDGTEYAVCPSIVRNYNNVIGDDGNYYLPSAAESIWPYVNQSLPYYSPPTEWAFSVPYRGGVAAHFPMCSRRPAAVNAEIIGATSGATASRKRSGAVSTDTYTLIEPVYFGARTSVSGYIRISTTPALESDAWMLRESISDPDGSVTWPAA